jgi:iron complex outermembrane receptor protein
MNDGLSRNVFLGTDWQYQNVEQASTNVTFNHQFNERWSLNATASYQNYTKDYFSTERVHGSGDKERSTNRFSGKDLLVEHTTNKIILLHK